MSFLLEESSVLEEIYGSGTLDYHIDNPQRIDEQMALTVGGVKLWPIVDALGSIFYLVNRSLSVVRQNQYDAYGTRSSTGSGPEVAWGFTGREHDKDTGLRKHRKRDVLESFEGWTQPDTVGHVAGLNLYEYSNGSPTVNTDPSGRWVSYDYGSTVMEKSIPSNLLPGNPTFLGLARTQLEQTVAGLQLVSEINIKGNVVVRDSNLNAGAPNGYGAGETRGLTAIEAQCPFYQPADLVVALDPRGWANGNAWRRANGSGSVYPGALLAHELGHANITLEFISLGLGTANVNGFSFDDANPRESLSEQRAYYMYISRLQDLIDFEACLRQEQVQEEIDPDAPFAECSHLINNEIPHNPGP